MHRHAGQPFLIDRAHLDESGDVTRKTPQPAKTDAVLGLIEARKDVVEAVRRVDLDLLAKSSLRIELYFFRQRRITRKNTPVFQQERESGSGGAGELLVKAAEVGRLERHFDHAGEIPLRVATGAVQREIRLTARNRRMNVSYIKRVRMVSRFREIVLIAVGKGRRRGRTRDHLRSAIGSKNPDRLHVGQGRFDLDQFSVQPRLVGDDFRRRAGAQHALDAVDRHHHGLKSFKGLLFHNVERTRNPLVGEGLHVAQAEPARKQEKRQWHNERGNGEHAQKTKRCLSRRKVLGQLPIDIRIKLVRHNLPNEHPPLGRPDLQTIQRRNPPEATEFRIQRPTNVRSSTAPRGRADGRRGRRRTSGAGHLANRTPPVE
jgi:hypothetical protein